MNNKQTQSVINREVPGIKKLTFAQSQNALSDMCLILLPERMT